MMTSILEHSSFRACTGTKWGNCSTTGALWSTYFYINIPESWFPTHLYTFFTVGRGCTMIQESRSLGSFHGLNEHFLYIQFGGGSVKKSWISYSVPSGQPWNHHHVIIQGEHTHCWNLSTTQAFMCENLIPSVRCYKGGWNHWKAHGIIHH